MAVPSSLIAAPNSMFRRPRIFLPGFSSPADLPLFFRRHIFSSFSLESPPSLSIATSFSLSVKLKLTGGNTLSSLQILPPCGSAIREGCSSSSLVRMVGFSVKGSAYSLSQAQLPSSLNLIPFSQRGFISQSDTDNDLFSIDSSSLSDFYTFPQSDLSPSNWNPQSPFSSQIPIPRSKSFFLPGNSTLILSHLSDLWHSFPRAHSSSSGISFPSRSVFLSSSLNLPV